MATYAAFLKESRMKFANVTKFNRKSGGAQWRDLRFSPSFEILLQSSVTQSLPRQKDKRYTGIYDQSVK
jgi:hypothetical protein